MTDSKNNKQFSSETEKNEETETGGNNLNKAVAIIKSGALRLDDSKIQENSDLFDLPITPQEYGISFRDFCKPKPKVSEEDKKIKNSKIILNNLLENQENMISSNQSNNNRVVTTAHYFNDFMNAETVSLELLIIFSLKFWANQLKTI